MIKAKRVDHFPDLKEPGQFLFYSQDGIEGHAGFTFLCPCGCGEHAGVQFIKGKNVFGWNWDGNEEEPTVTPSIRRLDGCEWHGHLTGGYFKEC